MKLFLLKIFLFTSIFIALTWILYPLFCHIIPSSRKTVFLSIVKSGIKKKVKKLILGDSCAKQLYDNTTFNGPVYSLACNQAISMAGQYILLNNFIKANFPDLPEEVCIIMDFNSFSNNLDQPYTFNYFLKPFYTKKNYHYFSANTIKIIQGIPYYSLSQWPLVSISLWCPDYKQEFAGSTHQFFSDVTRTYLFRIIRLCGRYGIRFKILPSIMPVSKKENFIIFSQSINKELVNLPVSLFDNYVKSGAFMPDNCFFDGIHLTQPFIPNDYYHLSE